MADHREEELEEEEVWAAMANHSPRHSKPQAICGRARDHHHHAPAALPLHCQCHGAASTSTSTRKRHMSYSSPPNKMMVQQQAAAAPSGGRRSAPVSIPDWSKIYGRSKAGDEDGGAEDDDGEEERVPPHEWLARKMAGSCQVTSFSVCEGAGRTLKGRDLSRVRNAVLSKTGFLEYSDDDHRQ